MTLTQRLKEHFAAGLILVAPLVVTVYVVKLLVGWAVGILDPVVSGTGLLQYTGNVELVAQMAAAVIIVSSITVLGYLAEKQVGKQTFGNVGRVVNIIPLVNTIYGSVRQVANALVEQNTRYESVVLVEYPRKGVYTIGLVTSQGSPTIEAATGETMFNVYLPNSPNPTGGRLLLVPESELIEIDVSVRRGLRMILTTGVVADEEQLPKTERTPTTVRAGRDSAVQTDATNESP